MWPSDVALALAYGCALFCVPFMFYAMFVEDSGKRNSRHKGLDLYYVLKRVLALPTIKRLKKKCTNTWLALDQEQQEQPRKLRSDRQSDTQVIYGADQEGNSIFLKLVLRQHRIAEATLCLRLKNNKVYRLPNEPEVLLCSIPSRKWAAEGLTIAVVEPLYRLRITYNGLLRAVSYGHQSSSDAVEHVKFNFIWNSADKPVYYPQDYPSSMLSDALAKERWRDGSWIEFLGDEKGYEQYGALQGFVAGEAFPQEQVLYFPGFRKRYWGTAEHSALRRDFSVFVVAEDGALFHVGARSLKRGCAKVKYGSILSNTGLVCPIEAHDIDLECTGEFTLPRVVVIHVKGNGKTYKCVLHFDLKATSTTRSSALHGWELKTLPAECCLNDQHAKAIAYFWKSKQGTGVDLPNPLLTPLKDEATSKEMVACFSSRLSKVTKLAGGKGSSLSLLNSLNSNKFVAQDGFIILANAFKHQMEHNPKLVEAVNNVKSAIFHRNEGDLQKACQGATQLFEMTPVEPSLSEMIVQHLHQLQRNSSSNGGNWGWAVRSSGLIEDAKEFSAAGQYKTVLGCRSQEELLKGVSACWGSSLSFQSIQYKRQLGLAIDCPMAVVVQPMVPAETSGVLFTYHPTTGDPSQMVITASYGLGESVVSGQVDPDTFVLKRALDGKLSLHSQKMGSKKALTEMCGELNTKGGTRVSSTDEKKANELSLREEQVLSLGTIGLELEKAYGSPRDIEWSIYDNKIYVQQSRPITSHNLWTDFELLHELDMPVMTNQEFLTVANVSEVIPGALTALSNSIILSSTAKELSKYTRRDDKEPFASNFLGTSHHHGVMNITNYCLVTVQPKLTVAEVALGIAIFGYPVIDEKIHSVALTRHGAMTPLKSMPCLFQTLKELYRNEHYIGEIKGLAREFALRHKQKGTALDKLQEIRDSLPEISKAVGLHGRASRVSMVYQIFLLKILAKDITELTSQYYCDISSLLSSCSDVISVEVPRTLERIVGIIKQDNAFEKFTKVDPLDGVNWLKINCPRAAAELNLFLEKHGHRAFRENEYKEDTWGMNPALVIKMLQSNRAEQMTRRSEHDTVDDMVADLVASKDRIKRFILRFFVNKCRKAVVVREGTKSELVRMHEKVKIAFRGLASQMVAEGLIPDPELIYHLTIYELQQVIQRKDPTLLRKAMRRQRLYPQWDKLQLPELIFGVPKPMETQKILPGADRGSKVTVKGTPASPGDVTARACVINSLDDINQLQAGDVLITYTTDIGWSPYFPMLSAVVTELGGLISHGAVVAREYGLPCIVSAKNAMAMFRTGDVVRLSGRTGTLELVADKPE